MARWLFLTVLLGIVLAVSHSSQADEPRGDETLQGKWKAISYIENGEVAERLEKTPIHWEFQKDTIIITAEDQQVFTIKGTYSINVASTPRTLEMKMEKQTDLPAQTMIGIYRIEKDQLTVCMATDGKRPKAFESKENSNAILIVFERSK